MHQETNQTMLQTLYDANANLGGLVIIFARELSYFLDCCSFVASGRGKIYLSRRRSSEPAMPDFACGIAYRCASRAIR